MAGWFHIQHGIQNADHGKLRLPASLGAASGWFFSDYRVAKITQNLLWADLWNLGGAGLLQT